MVPTDRTARATYMAALPRRALLTAADETALATRMRDPQLRSEDRIAARDALVTANLRLVVRLASRYRGPLEFEDVVQEGQIGLLRAVQDFDPARGRFSTYATPWIAKYMQRASENTGRAIRLLVHLYAHHRALRRATQQFTCTHGRAPRLDEQATAVGMPVAQVARVLQAAQPVASLDQPVGSDADDPLPVIDLLAAPAADWDAVLIGAEQRQALHAALATLTEREQTVLRLRYRLGETPGLPCRTLDAIGQQLGGVSREYVRQVEAKALKALRAQLADATA